MSEATLNAFGVKFGQTYRDCDTRMNSRRVTVKSVYFNQNEYGRFKAKTWYARCETAYGKVVTIACRNLVSYKWNLVSEVGALVGPC